MNEDFTRKNGPSGDTPQGLGTDPEAPSAFGRYQVIRHLASGGMGSVFLAHDGVLQREVAVKSIRPMPGAIGREFGARFLNEARCVASLTHPNIVPIFDLGLENETPYLVMEVVEGPAMRDFISERPMTAREARIVGIQIANALVVAHNAGIVHRDLKPANILAAGENSWKLVDFGVAHVPDSSLTTIGDFLGTPAYAAPESLEGNGFSSASDVYGLGATLFHALSGKPPYGLGNAVQIALRISTQPAPSLRSSNPELPEDLLRSIEQCLSLDPAQRPTAKALAEQLAAARPETVDTGETSLPPTRGWRPGFGLLAGLALAALVALIALSSGEEEGSSVVASGAAKATAPDTDELEASDTKARDSKKRDPETQPPTHAMASETDPDPLPDSPDESDETREESSDEIAATVDAAGAAGAFEAEPGIAGLDAIEQLIVRKRGAEAIRKLDALRRTYPKSAYLPYLEGTLQMQRRYWKDGFASYQAAIRNDARYKNNPRVIQDAIRALYSKSQPWRGSKFLIDVIGKPARPALERALGETANPRIKSRISSALKKLP